MVFVWNAYAKEFWNLCQLQRYLISKTINVFLYIYTQHGLFGCNKFQIKGLLNFFKVLATHITFCLTFNIHNISELNYLYVEL